ncbi:Reverse transcriptase (RNA-dependent DNA polymerase) [Popillia japonica]|uniref:Reverse transcriptase (RNA-dependent DNA polymerase) n=1 Tax=Popillia japonica TaxID=7064 RepID=A0AAW1ISR4_POPJA
MNGSYLFLKEEQLLLKSTTLDRANSEWIVSFLEGRAIVIKIDDARSREFSTSIGTPHGSFWAPSFFLLFINDLPSHISSGKTFLYADDTCIVVSHSDKQQIVKKVEAVIDELYNWCATNRLTINDNKTVITEFYNKHRKPSINH